MTLRPTWLRNASIVACARWEKNYIAEWVTYHRLLGFDHIYVYSNDDTPDDLFEVIRPLQILNPDFLSYTHWPEVGDQRGMYMHFLEHRRAETRWIMFLDIDEFVNTNGRQVGDILGTLDSDVGALYLNWIMFGNNYHAVSPGGSTLANYVRRQASVHPYTKNIVRSDAIDFDILKRSSHSGFWHGWEHMGPKEALLPSLRRTVNVLGDDMSDYYTNFPNAASIYLGSKATEILSLPRIHHYSIRSEEDFLRREARSVAGTFAGQRHWGNIYRDGSYVEHLKYLNAVEDTTLLQFWQRNIQYEYLNSEASVLSEFAPERVLP